MPKDSEVLVDILAKTIIKSQNACLSAAQNKVLIDIGSARNVTIQNMSIIQLAAADSRCSQTIQVDVGSLEFDIQQTLDATVTYAEEDESTTLKFKNDISNAVRVGNLEGCISSAVNDFKVSFERVDGNVDINDLKLNQFATASVSKCMQRADFKVGDVPLAQFLEDSIRSIKSLKIIPLESACTEIAVLYYIMYGCIGGAILIVIGAAIWFSIWRKNYAKS